MRPPEKILVATDFSAASELAIAGARVLAAGSSPHVVLVHVIDTKPLDEDLESHDERQAEREKAAHARLDEIRANGLGKIEHVTTALIRGRSVADELCRFAADEDADVMVVATHGRTGLAHLLIGSVAERVVRHAPCPVFTLRSKKKG